MKATIFALEKKAALRGRSSCRRADKQADSASDVASHTKRIEKLVAEKERERRKVTRA